jgi:GxxExxY protein
MPLAFPVQPQPLRKVNVSPEVEALASVAVRAAFDVHKELGPGLLENVYEAAFAHELELRGVRPKRQVPIAVTYKSRVMDLGFRADVILEDMLLIELKAVDQLIPVHKAQVITYLKILNLPLGLLINFNEVLIKNGIDRVLNLNHRVS